MDVRVKDEGLRPGVQHRDGAGHGSQTTPADGMERLESDLEEHRVAEAAVGQEERMQCLWHREDQVEVLHREQATRLGLHPACLRQALALGAVAVAAGVVDGSFTAAVIAHLDVAAQMRRSAHHDVSNHPTALRPQLF